MPKEERDHLLQEVEQIMELIEVLQPIINEEPVGPGAGVESSRARIRTLRKVLARDMELLHAN